MNARQPIVSLVHPSVYPLKVDGSENKGCAAQGGFFDSPPGATKFHAPQLLHRPRSVLAGGRRSGRLTCVAPNLMFDS
jgi:hypothetical protein